MSTETPVEANASSLADPSLPDAASPRPFARLSLRLALIMALLVMTVAGTLSYLFHRLSIEAVERARLEAALDVADSIVSRLAQGVPVPAVLERILSEYVHASSEIVAVEVALGPAPASLETLAVAGMRIAKREERDEAVLAGAPVARRIESDTSRLWSVAVPFHTDRGGSGIVSVWSSLQAAELVTVQNRRIALLVVPPSVLILVGLLGVALRREVLSPLERLRQAMLRAELGDLHADAPVRRRDEIGFITSQYNQMLARIRHDRDEREALLTQVQGFNVELTQAVAAATSELKSRNEELERLNDALYALQERLVRSERRSVAHQMTARVAHKIGTPLNLISGHVQILARTRAGDLELHEKLSVIQSQIEKLTDSVREILDETRASYRLEPLDLHVLLTTIVALLHPTLTARNVHLSSSLECQNSVILGNEAELEQVFLSLINNSLDAMPRGGNLALRTEDHGKTVRVVIADDGVGIAARDLPHIFAPFFTTKPPGLGTGLGLAIVREILSSHRATIRVDSVEGEGTTFCIDFPRSEAP